MTTQKISFTTLDNAKVAQRCADVMVKIERIFYLATLPLDEPFAMPNDLDDMIQDWDSAVDALPDRTRDLLRETMDTGVGVREAFGMACYETDCFGWIVEAHRPSRDSHSWGSCNVQVFYGETADEAVGKAMAWGESRVKVDA